jgi:hypothetical protein
MPAGGFLATDPGLGVMAAGFRAGEEPAPDISMRHRQFRFVRRLFSRLSGCAKENRLDSRRIQALRVGRTNLVEFASLPLKVQVVAVDPESLLAVRDHLGGPGHRGIALSPHSISRIVFLPPLMKASFLIRFPHRQ